ncbi:MAG: penicillin acylase family protein [Bacteroidales bacterium]
MNNFKRQFLIIVFIAGLTNSCTCQSLDKQKKNAEILWDNYGVPHIYAGTEKEMYYAYGWAQMNNHANLILKLYAQARGKAAEYWGNTYFESDKLVHLFNISELSQKFYQSQNTQTRENIEAFVHGINAFAKENPQLIGDDFKQVLPVSAQDVISHTLRIIYLEFISKEDIYTSQKSVDAGSNAIAIAPSRSASKNAMLVINPHLPWSDYFLWFESHLVSKDFDFYGVSLVGMPTLTMGFNSTHGWAHTINPIDVSDRYELTLDGNGYKLDGKKLDFSVKEDIIRVKQGDGSLLETKTIFKYSKQGPVVAENDKKAFAVRIAGLENYGIFEQYSKMAKAKTFAEFETAIKMLQIPMFNIVYADNQGNIFYLFNGSIPVRNEGDFSFWKGTMDGSQSKYIWSKTNSYNDLPKCLNPATGFVQNCNDAPWTCTEPAVLDPKNYAPYISSVGTFLRPQRSVNMVKNDKSITYDELISIKLNTGMEAADRFLDDLLAAVEKYPDSTANKAALILKSWDKKTEVNSRGAVLFARWWDFVRSDIFEIGWNIKNPNATPDGLKDPEKAVELLVKAANEVNQKYGSMDIAWGDVYRFRLNGKDYPANGGDGNYGIFRTVYFADDKDNKKFAVAGETFTAVTEFGPKLKAKVLLSYGNATQPGNKHIGDQLQMLSEKQLRDALMDKNDVLKNLEKRELLIIENQ